MSKSNLENLSNQLQQKRQELSAVQRNVSTEQSELRAAQSTSQATANQLSQALVQQATLNSKLQNQVNLFKTLKHLLNSYREERDIILDTRIVITKTTVAEKLAHTDVLKEISQSKYEAVFDLALAKITDLDYQDSDGKTMLIHAIINGFYYGVGRLLQRGANVNLRDKQDVNAYMYCAQIPHIKYIKQIAEKTDDINCKSSLFGGDTALHLVVSNTHTLFTSEVLELKLANIAYLGKGNVVADSSENIGAILLGKREVDGYTIQQEKALTITKFLIDKGADINAQNDEGLTPFFMSCDYGFRYLTHELLKQYQGLIDFSSLALRNDVKTLRFLEADTNILDIIGKNLWHYASQCGAINIMKFLKNKIPNIIDLKTTDSVNSTALHIASESDQFA